MSTEDEFGTCPECGADDWLAVVATRWMCTDCESIYWLERERVRFEEYDNGVYFDDDH